MSTKLSPYFIVYVQLMRSPVELHSAASAQSDIYHPDKEAKKRFSKHAPKHESASASFHYLIDCGDNPNPAAEYLVATMMHHPGVWGTTDEISAVADWLNLPVVVRCQVGARL